MHTPIFIDEYHFNSIGSITLSLLGILGYYLSYKKIKDGEYILIGWAILQLFVITFLPLFNFNLTQGASYTLGPSIETIVNDNVNIQLSFEVNILAIFLVSILYFM